MQKDSTCFYWVLSFSVIRQLPVFSKIRQKCGRSSWLYHFLSLTNNSIVIPKEIRRTLPIRESDLLLKILTLCDRHLWTMEQLRMRLGYQ